MSGDHNMYASGSGDGQRSGWRKRTIMEMARDCGINFHQAGWPELERFAEQVREEATAEANAKANASWTLMCEKMVAIEREACAKVCDFINEKEGFYECGQAEEAAAQIRARGQA